MRKIFSSPCFMNIYWLSEKIRLVSTAEEADIYARLLSAQENAIYRELKVAKRRNEWLAGRLAIRRLISKVKGVHEADISVVNNELGSPVLFLRGKENTGKISISHSNQRVAVCYSDSKDGVGIDLEEIVPRDDAFRCDYFTPSEQNWVTAGNKNEKNLRLNMLWSAKESVLKCTGEGLHADPLGISILPEAKLPVFGGWQIATAHRVQNDIRSRWWVKWKIHQGMVLTICASHLMDCVDLSDK